MKVQNNQNNAFPPQFITVGSLIKSQLKTLQPPQDKRLRMVYPKITTKDFKTTINNYIKHIAAYNKDVAERNPATIHYNKLVEKYTNQHPITDKKLALITKFTKQFNSSKPAAYNEAATSFNKLHGKYLKLRKIQKVQPATRLFFEAFLHAYLVQLLNRNELNRNTNVAYSLPIPKIEIHPYFITTQEREGVQNLDVSTKTVRNHRDRLEEAGVLLEKQFNGSEKPVSYVLQPSILAISEGYLQKSQLPQNQFFKSQKKKELPHVKVTTRTYKKNIEKKEIVNNSQSLNKENATHLLSIKNYKNTKKQVSEKVSPAENFTENIGQFLQGTLLSPLQLAENCAENKYLNYKPIRLAYFLQEAKENTLSDGIFREVAKQEFIKRAADINKHNQASFKSWRLAYNYIDDQFGCLNFKNGAFSKLEIINKLDQFTWRINWAKKWFNDRDWQNVRYASDYFDPAFNNSNFIGFKYTSTYWKKAQEAKKNRESAKKSKQIVAKRAEKLNKADKASDRRLTTAIYKFLNNHYTFEQLNRYVVNELPKKQQDKLPARLDVLLIRKNRKKSPR